MRFLILYFVIFSMLCGAQNIQQNTITINSGGTFFISSPNRVSGSPDIILNGGDLNITAHNGTEHLGALTLTSSSSITLESISSFRLYFQNSSLQSWTNTLTINNWTGDSLGGTADRIFFGSSSGLTSTQLSQISFTGFGTGAIILTSGELVPVVIPETPTIVYISVLALIIIIFEIVRVYDEQKPIIKIDE